MFCHVDIMQNGSVDKLVYEGSTRGRLNKSQFNAGPLAANVIVYDQYLYRDLDTYSAPLFEIKK